MTKFTGYIEGQTPLDPNETDELIPDHITLLSELNELEQANITTALEKYLGGAKKKWDLTDSNLLRQIHKDMFDEVWGWAGKYRTTTKNIGVFPEQIVEEVRKACDDLGYWLKHNTFPPIEMAVRFHHRLVAIHPFPNGNGRFSRIVADILLQGLGLNPLPWGGNDFSGIGTVRKNYLAALKVADKGDIAPLLSVATQT